MLPRLLAVLGTVVFISGPAAHATETQITNDPSSDQRPAWSPDGNTIVFDSNRSGTRDLYTVPATGGTVTQLTTNLELDQHPDWAPGSDTIVFSAVVGGGLADIYSIPATGGTPTLLIADAGTNDRFPAWSPDSTQIAYSRDFDIYVAPAGGGTPVQITTDPGNDLHPTWSPDGTQIAFLSNRSGNNDIWIIPSTGGTATQLTTHTSNDGAPDWSPNGDVIAFQSNRGGNNCIFTIPVTGGPVTQITTTGSNDVQPDFAPDGSAIVFARVNNIWIATLPQADLSVTKTVDDSVPSEGDTVEFTVTLMNNGPDATTGIEVTDLLPAGLTFQSSTATSGTYVSGTGLWAVASLAAAGMETLTITAEVDSGTAGTTIVNTATVTASDLIDPDSGNDSDDASVNVSGTVVGTFTQLTNVGASDQRPAWAPDGATIVFDSNRTSVARDLWLIPSTGGTATQLTTNIEIDQHADWSPASDKIVFSAVVGGGAPDLYEIPVTGGTATLLFSDPGTNDRFPAWSPDSTQIAYSRDNDIYVMPAGGGTPVQITTDPGVDLHPTWSPDGSQLAFLSNRSGNNDIWTIPSTGGPATQLTTHTSNDGAPDWSPDGTLIAFQSNRTGNNEIWWIPAGGGSPAQITSDPGNDVQPDWSPDGTQIVFARNNNLWIFSNPSADIGVTKSVDDSNPNEGDTIQYTIDVTNHGSFDATGVEVTDLLPAGVTYQSDIPTAGSYDSGTGVWTVGSLADGVTETLTISATVDGGTGGSSIINTAAVTASSPFDPNAANDTDFAVVFVKSVDLAVVKQVSNSNPNEGDSVDFTVFLVNFGPSIATNVQVTDLLPAGLTYASSSTSQGTYDDVTGIWDVGTKTPGATTADTLIISATVDAGTAGQTLENVATVTQVTEADVNPLNDTFSAFLTIQAADLGIVKTVSDPMPSEGDDVSYIVVVTNNGPNDATAVQVLEPLPLGVTFTSDDQTKGTYDSGTGLWLIGSIPSGESDTLTVLVSVDSGTGGTTIVNTATALGADQGDPNASNDSDSASIDVQVPVLGVETQITTAGSDQRPAWAPDQSGIVFDSNRSGNRDLWVVPVNGGSATQLTTSIEIDQHADWSPSATRIVFSAIMGGGQPDLYEIPAGGGTPVLLFEDPGTNDRFPSWSPDSTQIAYSRDSDIYLMPAGGGTPTQLTTDPGNDLHPSWSPDGSQIVFLSNRSGNNDLWVIPSTGGTATQLTTHTGNDGAPDWSPDGSQIAFQSNRGGNNDVWVIPSTGGTATQITTTSDNDVQPDWSPSGGQIVFARSSNLWKFAFSGADLQLDKSVSDASPNEGDSIDYTIVVTNNGPEAASGVALSDILPAGVTFQSSVASQGAYDNGTGLWPVGSLSVGASATLTITATVDPSTGGSTITNTVTVAALDQIDPGPADDADSADITVLSADVAVAKSVDDPTPGELQTIHYTVVATNLGPDAVTGLEVTDLLPTGVTFQSYVATQGTYDDVTGLWEVGTVAVSDADTLTITATVDIGTGGTLITNTASVTAADQADPDGGNDSDSAGVNVAVPAAGVETQITTAASDQRPAWAPDGAEIVFDSNRSGNRDLWSVPAGGGTATQITTNIELDQHADWSPSSTRIVFSAVMGGGLPDLYTVPRTGGTPVLLHADAGTNDRFPAWSPDSTQIAYARDNDIFVIPAAGGTPVQLTTNPATDLHPSWSPDGTQIVFLSNRSGNNDLWIMPSTGEPAAQLTTHTANDGAPDWSPDGTRVAFQSNRSGNNDVWMIPSGGGTAIQVTSTSSNDVQPDWSPSGGQITFARDGGIWVSALLGADLGVDKTVSDAAPNEGDSIDYVLTLTNLGPSVATTVTVSDVLPAGVTFQSAAASAGSYDDGTGEWSVASVAAASSETLTITVTVDGGTGGTTITNTASVTGLDQTDPGGANDSDSVDITVPTVDLAVTKDVDNASPNEGETIIYTVDVENLGPDDASGVEVTDLLPAGVTYQSDTPSAGSYDDGSGVWTVGALGQGVTESLTITASVDPGTGGTTITNSASLTASDQADSNPGNDADSVDVTIPSVDLAVTKGVDDGTPHEGDTVTYTVDVENLGPDDATGVEVTDLLPAGVTYQSDTPSAGSYDDGSGIWAVGGLANGVTQTLTITATVDGGTAGSTITNVASLTGSDQADSNPGNDADSADVVVRSVDLAVTKSVDNAAPAVGDDVTYTVTLTNVGPETGTTVGVTDLLPAGVAFLSHTLTRGNYDSNTGFWAIGTVGVGVTDTLTITARVLSGTDGTTVTNTASITSADQGDANPSNNTDSADIDVLDAGALRMSSQTDRTFFVGDPAATISPITVTDDAAVVTAANDLRIRIPAGFDMSWDTSVTTASIAGSAAGKVSSAVTYEDGGQTLVVDVSTDFAGGDQVVVSSLKFTSFSAPSSPDELELEVANDGAVSALDERAVAILPAGLVATRSTAIEITPDGQEVWVVNPDHGTVSVIGTQGANENVKLAEITVGAEPWTLDIHPSNGEVWVASLGDDHVYVVDAVSRTVVDSIAAGFETFGVAFSPDGTLALVTASGSDEIFAIDVATRTIEQTLPAMSEPRGIAWRADGERAWVSHLTTTHPYGLLTTVFTGSWTTTNIALSAIIDDTLGGVPNTLQNLTVGPAPGDSILWVPNVLENSAAGALAGNPLTPGNMLHATVRLVNVRPLEPSDLDQSTYYLSESGTPVSGPTAVDFKNGKAYVANMSSDDVTVLTADFLDPAELGVLAAGQAPIGVVAHRTLDRAYVANWLSRDVTVLDTDSDTVVTTVGTAAFEPLSAALLNGKQLFFTSTGPMSENNRIACASCHAFGGHDGQAWDLSQFGRHVRSTPDLRGNASSLPHLWTAGFDEMADLNHEIIDLMGGDGLIPGGGNPPLGDPNDGLSQDMDDLGAWLASLEHRIDTPAMRTTGGYSDDALAGREIFMDPLVGCADCHSGTRFTDSALESNPFVRHDVGTCDPADENAGMGFDTPSLIGLWATAPYLHDNRAATLHEVFTVHNPDDLHGTTSHLTSGEIDQLVAFLESINPTTGEPGVTDAGVDLPAGLQTQFQAVFPNPFAAETSLRFALERANSQVVIEIFNIEGRRVRTLLDRRMPRGTHVVGWDGRNHGGQAVSAGFYYARLIVDGEKKGGKKMTLLR